MISVNLITFSGLCSVPMYSRRCVGLAELKVIRVPRTYIIDVYHMTFVYVAFGLVFLYTRRKQIDRLRKEKKRARNWHWGVGCYFWLLKIRVVEWNCGWNRD